MTDAIVTAAASVVVALMGTLGAWVTARAERARKKDRAEDEKRNDRRQRESLLLLGMVSASIDLTVGVAMALKHGHANGEIESGLKAVEKAQEEYQAFHDTIALEQIS